jgi:hypothetical protein
MTRDTELNLSRTTPLGHWTVTIRANRPATSVSVGDIICELKALNEVLMDAIQANLKVCEHLLTRTVDRR